MRNLISLSIIAVLSIAASTPLSAQPIKDKHYNKFDVYALFTAESFTIHINTFEYGKGHGHYTEGSVSQMISYGGSEFFSETIAILEGSITPQGIKFLKNMGYKRIADNFFAKNEYVHIVSLNENKEGNFEAVIYMGEFKQDLLIVKKED